MLTANFHFAYVDSPGRSSGCLVNVLAVPAPDLLVCLLFKIHQKMHEKIHSCSLPSKKQ